MRGWNRIPSASVRAETLNLSSEVGIEYMSNQYISLGSGMSGITTASNANDTYWYYPVQTWTNNWPTIQPITQTVIKEIIKEREVTKEVEKRTLFKVYVVNPKKNGELLLDGKSVIAINENQAMLKAGVAEIAEKVGLDLDQVDVYVQAIGTFIRPRKDIQRVKITKEEE